MTSVFRPVGLLRALQYRQSGAAETLLGTMKVRVQALASLTQWVKDPVLL